MLLVPMFGDVTQEDPSVVDPDERSRRYGQHDHVRLYGHDGVYEERLKAAGFTVERVSLISEMDPALVRRYRVRVHEPLHLCT